MTFLTDVIQVETTQNGNALELRFSRPVTADDRKSLMDAHNAALNTRPAAPVEGLVRYNLFECPDYGPSMRRNETGEYVRFDQAEAIIAAERAALTKEEADHTRSLEERDRYHDIADKLAQAIADRYQADIGEHSNINDPWQNALNLIEADNAALTAQVKEWQEESERKSGDWFDFCNAIGIEIDTHEAVADAINTARSNDGNEFKALETQLAAARKALELIDKAVSAGRFIRIREIARAALEAKP